MNSDASLSKKKRTLQVSPEKGLVWDTVFEVKKEDTVFPTIAICLESMTVQRCKEISDSVMLMFVKMDVLREIGLSTIKENKISNVICLEEMESMYPHLGSAWDGTVEDAYVLIAGLMKYKVLVTDKNVSSRASTLSLQVTNEKPFRLWWVTQYYVPDKAKRKREIDTCLENNLQSPLIDRVVLLNEMAECPVWCTPSKIEERVIGHRLTYQDVLREALTFPYDVVVVFANADICIDTASWRQLWDVDLTDVCLALLRYDVPDSGLKSEAKIFGPRADSQDTWVIRACDVKKRGEDILKSMDIRFGQMGCDNAFALEIFRKKFLVVNPCLSLKTYHYHNSGVRNYKREDVVNNPFFMYCNPTGFHDLEPVLTNLPVKHTVKPVAIERPVLGSGANQWIDRMNRKLEEGTRPWTSLQTVTPVPEQVMVLEGCFQNENGLCYDANKMYVGKGSRAQQKWSESEIKRIPVTIPSEQGLVIPFDTEVMKSRERYMLEYLSRVLRLRATANQSGDFLCPDQKEIVEALHMFQWETPQVPLIKYEPNIQVWHKSAAVMPVSENNMILTEDIEALRRACKQWNPVIQEFGGLDRIVIIQDDKVLTDELVTELEEVLEHAWNVRIVYSGKTSGERMWEQLRGAWGVIVGGGLGVEVSAWNWLLPKGAVVVEVNGSLPPNSKALHMSAVAGLEHRMVWSTQRDVILDEVWSEHERTKQAKEEVNENLPIVWLPRRDMEGYFAHAGDSFREMARLWAKKGLCRVKEHTAATQCWWGDVGAKGVLLYDRPNHDWRLAAPLIEREYSIALYGNPKPPMGDEKSHAWFFWPRRPELVEELVAEKVSEQSWSQRRPGPVFYGKIENRVQEKRRCTMDWSLACEKDCYVMSKGAETKYPLTHKEYLMKLASSRFGLCLAGYGYKCHREVECMAMGCVPVVAPEVDMDSYAEPPVEGIHYIRVQSPEEAHQRLSEIGEQEWTTMSQACRNWWVRNCSCEGSFQLTKRLVEEKNICVK